MISNDDDEDDNIIPDTLLKAWKTRNIMPDSLTCGFCLHLSRTPYLKQYILKIISETWKRDWVTVKERTKEKDQVNEWQW